MTYKEYCDSLNCKKSLETFNDGQGPRWIKATDNLSTGISIYWENIPEVQYYALFRDGELLETNIISNSYEDTNVEKDRVYTYQVMGLLYSCGTDLSPSDTGVSPVDGYAFYTICRVSDFGDIKFYVSDSAQYIADGSSNWIQVPAGLNTVNVTDPNKLLYIQSQNPLEQIQFVEDDDTTTSYISINIIYGGYLTSFENMCDSLPLLSNFGFESTCKVQNWNYAFNNCVSLESFPYIDSSSGTSFLRTWSNCQNLKDFPEMDFTGATQLDGTWAYCGFTSFPKINTSGVKEFNYTWNNCNLISFPEIDTSSATQIVGTWGGCEYLLSFPLLDFSNCLSLEGAWRRCSSLRGFPLIDTSLVTNFSRAWQSCENLEEFPFLDVSSGTDFTLTWYNTAIVDFPNLEFHSGIKFNWTWAGCDHLRSVGVISHAGSPENQEYQYTFASTESLVCITEINTEKCDWSLSSDPTDPNYFNPTEGMFDRCFGLMKPNETEIQQLTTNPGYHFINDTQCPIEDVFLCEIDIHDYSTNIWFSIDSGFTIDNNGLIETLEAGEHTITPVYDGSTWNGIKIYTAEPLTYIKFSSTDQSLNDNYKSIVISSSAESFTNGNSIFKDLQQAEILTLNTIYLTDLTSAFENCSSATVITIQDTEYNQYWNYTFRNCSSMITFPEFNMIYAGYFISTYEGCTNLKYLPAQKTRNGLKFDYMFKDCINLECMGEIDTRNKDYDNIDIPGMFENCPKLSEPSPIVQDDLVDKGPGNWWVNQYSCPSSRPTIPGNLKASSNRWDGVLVTWEASDRADFYRVFKDNDEFVGDTPDNTTLEILDTNCVEGVIYTYYAYAVRVETIDGQLTEIESKKSNLDNGNIIIPVYDRPLNYTSNNMWEFTYKYRSYVNSSGQLVSGDECDYQGK